MNNKNRLAFEKLSNKEKLDLAIRTKDKKILEYLAGDINWQVRLYVAHNEKTNIETLIRMSEDKNKSVRESVFFAISTRRLSKKDRFKLSKDKNLNKHLGL